MNKLIIVAGASGAGKTFLLENLYQRYSDIEPIKKMSTRKERDYEKSKDTFIDLIYDVKREIIDRCEYHYKYENYFYGLEKSEIEYVLDRGKSPIVIIRDSRTVEKMKKDYPKSVTIFLQNILSGKDLKEQLFKKGREDIKIAERMDRFQKDFKKYCAYGVDLYDYVILNELDESTFLSQFEKIYKKEAKKGGPSKTITLISGKNYEEKFREVARALELADYNYYYSLYKLTEFLTCATLSQSVEDRLMNTDFVILDMDGNDRGILYYYQGFLKAHNIDFITLIPEEQPSKNYITTLDIDYYTCLNDFSASIKNKFHEYLKKPKSIFRDQPKIIHFMEEAIIQAEKSTFEDDKNRPYVGAILIDENYNIVARANRGGDNGNGQHAEYRLLDSIKEKCLNLSKCILFVTLEPCTTRNHPKTPCAQRVIDSGIKTVYVGMLDPDIRIRGIGVTKMKEAGIKVDMFPPEIENKIRELNKNWIQFIKEKDYKTDNPK
ncbi:MAG: hypothetical protein A2491_02205 [Bacteroidetes bacterium RIFOXYC12_FULL_35_7]|nr:MAG: hypothetical protein A2491_02205 [Bacteroidetes bacterium RIFOXYC12_FULL_35_7]